MLLDAISSAVAVAFDQFGAAATFTPDGGSPRAVRAIRMRKDPHFGEVSSPGYVIQLLASELAATPVSGDVITLGATQHRVRVARPGPQDLLWLCDVDEVSP